MTHESTGEQPDYLSYLLRLWRMRRDQTMVPSNEASWRAEGRADSGVHESTWRASLQDPRTGKRQGFASLDELFACLLQRTGTVPPADSYLSDERTPETKGESEED